MAMLLIYRNCKIPKEEFFVGAELLKYDVGTFCLCAFLNELPQHENPLHSITQQIADEKDYKTIAINMEISPATVKTHTINFYAKLGINDRQSALSRQQGVWNPSTLYPVANHNF